MHTAWLYSCSSKEGVHEQPCTWHVSGGRHLATSPPRQPQTRHTRTAVTLNHMETDGGDWVAESVRLSVLRGVPETTLAPAWESVAGTNGSNDVSALVAYRPQNRIGPSLGTATPVRTAAKTPSSDARSQAYSLSSVRDGLVMNAQSRLESSALTAYMWPVSGSFCPTVEPTVVTPELVAKQVSVVLELTYPRGEVGMGSSAGAGAGAGAAVSRGSPSPFTPLGQPVGISVHLRLVTATTFAALFPGHYETLTALLKSTVDAGQLTSLTTERMTRNHPSPVLCAAFGALAATSLGPAGQVWASMSTCWLKPGKVKRVEAVVYNQRVQEVRARSQLFGQPFASMVLEKRTSGAAGTNDPRLPAPLTISFKEPTVAPSSETELYLLGSRRRQFWFAIYNAFIHPDTKPGSDGGSGKMVTGFVHRDGTIIEAAKVAIAVTPRMLDVPRDGALAPSDIQVFTGDAALVVSMVKAVANHVLQSMPLSSSLMPFSHLEVELQPVGVDASPVSMVTEDAIVSVAISSTAVPVALNCEMHGLQSRRTLRTQVPYQLTVPRTLLSQTSRDDTIFL